MEQLQQLLLRLQGLSPPKQAHQLKYSTRMGCQPMSRLRVAESPTTPWRPPLSMTSASSSHKREPSSDSMVNVQFPL